MAQQAIKYWLDAGAAGIAYFNVDLSDNATLYRASHNRLTRIDGLDFPTLRTAIEGRAVADGDILLPSFRSARYVTLEGVIVPNGALAEAAWITQREVQEDQLKKVLNAAVRTDSILRWTRRDAITRRLTCRLWEPPRFPREGVRPGFQFQLVAPDPYIYNDTQDSPTFVAGFTTMNVTNDGDADSYPVVRVFGPNAGAITGFTLTNTTTGKLITISGLAGTDLDTGVEYIDFDMAAKSVKHSSGFSRLSKITMSTATFFPLVPGVNVLSVSGVVGGGALNQVQVFFRDAWIGG